jgi:succinate dehydrogenase hydrophobic anchor subunit
MLRTLQRVSGFCFYLLGSSFILAWLLFKLGYAARFSSMWMQAMDLPLIFSALVYGGLCFYFGLIDFFTSKILRWALVLVLTVIFVIVLVRTFA